MTTAVIAITFVLKRSPMRVFRIESAGEWAAEFPSLVDATREPPMSGEAHIATSPEGVVLAEALVMVDGRRMWTFTVAGRDVLRGQVAGLSVAS